MYSKDQRWLFAAAALVVLACIAYGAVLFKTFQDPSTSFLRSSDKARWILYDEPADLVAKNPGDVVTSFNYLFTVASAPKDAVLTVYAMKNAAVFIDGNLINKPEYPLDDWKKPLRLNMDGYIVPGQHELRINVLNKNGPAVLLAYCEPLNISTGPEWQASRDRVNWYFARDAEEAKQPRLATMFPRSDKALVSVLAYIMPVFLIVFAWTLANARGGVKWLNRITPSASTVRWIVLFAWAALAINNIGKLQADAGFDIEEHLKYIRYVAQNWRIPLPTEGWQMFQSPLYYIVSAPVYLFSRHFSGLWAVEEMLRVIPLFCGIAQVELTYRTLRSVYPGREDLQALGTVVGGLLPMNIYISQYAGNEPMAGFFTAATLTVIFGIINKGREWPANRIALCGIFFGLALLSKVTPVLLIPPLVFILAYTLSLKGFRPARICAWVLLFISIAFFISGWYYLRNWIEIGRPFAGGWDISRGVEWWQDPGYRTSSQLFTFGRSLLFPIHSSYKGFLDAFYSSFWTDGYLSALNDFAWRPAWNYDFLTSVALLALVPSAGIITGAAASLLHPEKSLRNGELFALSSVAVYFAALLYLFIKVPIYSTVKATYTLGLIPCYAVLCSAGFNALTGSSVARAFVFGSVASWAVSAYLAYFII